MADQLSVEIRTGRFHPDRQQRYSGVSIFDIDCVEEPWRARLAPAKKQLIADFRTRVARGTILLTGLQTQPVLAADRVVLSPVWAERMRFFWKRQEVGIESTLFVDVTGAAKAQNAVIRTPTLLPAPNRRIGRPDFSMAEFVAIARERLGIRHPTNKAEADALRDEFRRRYPALLLPTIRSVQDHVTRIYTAAVHDAVPLNPVK